MHKSKHFNNFKPFSNVYFKNHFEIKLKVNKKIKFKKLSAIGDLNTEDGEWKLTLDLALFNENIAKARFFIHG